MSPTALTLIVLVASIGFWRPHWGVVAFLVLIPLESLLPDTLGGASALLQSPLAAVGGAGVLGAALTLFLNGRLRPGAAVNLTTILGLMFIAWMFLAHPGFAWSGWDGRNWVFTFGQLWLLALVAGAALDTDDKHQFAVGAFAVACLVSALAAILAGPAAGARAQGLGLGINAVARQYAVATVFAIYLGMRFTRMWLRIAAVTGAAILAVGVVFTESRAGLLLEAVALVLVPMISAQKRVTRTLLNGLLVSLIALWMVPQDTVETVLLRFVPGTALPGAENESIEANIRYKLWDAGMTMWRENPIVGVGPGEYADLLPDYLPETKRNFYSENLTPHSLYVAILSQTGAVGLAVFLAMMLAALSQAWRAVSRTGGKSPAAAWGMAFFLLALGGSLKDESADKLTWLCMGVAAASVVPPLPLLRRRAMSSTAPTRPRVVRALP